MHLPTVSCCPPCAAHDLLEPTTDSAPPESADGSVLTQQMKYESRWNANETALTTRNVSCRLLGAVQLAVDDMSTPALVVAVSPSQPVRNVVYVATVNNTLYAYDGDDGKTVLAAEFTAPACGRRGPPT